MPRRLSSIFALLLLAIAAYYALRVQTPPTHVRFVLYRPAAAIFYLDRNIPAGSVLEFAHGDGMVSFGRPGDIGLACPQRDREEPNGFRVYANGQWYLSGQASRPSQGDLVLGTAGDVPFCADFDGDGRPDIGIFRDGEWIVRTAGTLFHRDIRFRLGEAGDLPVVLNVRGGGNRTDRRNLVYGVFRKGLWYVDLDGDGTPDATHAFGGMPQDRPLLIPHWGWSGAATYSLVIFRDGLWYVKPDPDGEKSVGFGYGGAGDVPSVLY